MVMTEALELHKQGVVVSMHTELLTLSELELAQAPYQRIEKSRRKIEGYCDELDQIERQEAA